MFETDSFKNQLESTVSSETSQAPLPRYETQIVQYLQDLATANESALMETEVKKAAASRRGIPEAMESARQLVKLASQYALSEKRTVLQLTDVQRAYRASFCQVWPFCK